MSKGEMWYKVTIYGNSVTLTKEEVARHTDVSVWIWDRWIRQWARRSIVSTDERYYQSFSEARDYALHRCKEKILAARNLLESLNDSYTKLMKEEAQ